MDNSLVLEVAWFLRNHRRRRTPSGARPQRMTFMLRSLVLGLALSWSWAANAGADVFRLLASDYEAAQARVDLIDQAATSIETSYYGIGNDRIGAMFLSRLESAARRGLRVKVTANAE